MSGEQGMRLGVSLLMAVSCVIGLVLLGDHFAERSEREIRRAVAIQLQDTVAALGHRFDRLQWFSNLGKRMLEGAQKRGFSPVQFGKALKQRIPFVEVMVFGRDGRILFPEGVERRRIREKIWPHVLFLARHPSSERGAWQSPEVQRLFSGLFGPAALPTDFSHHSGKPSICFDNVTEKISWVIPHERLKGQSASDAAGVWVMTSTRAIPTRELAAHVLREKLGVDTAFILNSRAGQPVIEAQSGQLLIGRRTARKFLGNTLMTTDRLGNAWAAFYIPGEFGRYMVTGVARDRLLSFWTKHRSAFVWALAFLCLLTAGWSSGFLHPLERWERGISPKIIGFFLLTSVIPLCSVWKFGFDRILDTERLNRGRWEERIKSDLSNRDREYLNYLEEQRKRFEEWQIRLEAILRPDLPHTSRQGALRAWYQNLEDRNIDGDILLLDRWGNEARYTRGDEHSDAFGELADGRILLRKYMVRVASMEGMKPPEKYVSSTILLSGKTLDAFLGGIEKTFKKWKKIHSGKRTRLSRASILRAPTYPHETLGLLVSIFWEEDFARPFIESWLKQSHGDIRFLAISDENRIIPPVARLPVGFQHMVDRSRIFRTREVEMIEINGRPTLVMVWTPRHLGGYQLVGMVDAASIHADGRFMENLMKATTLGGVLFLLLAAMLLSKKFLVRIRKLHHFVEDIIAERFESRVEIAGKDELAMVAATFNEMAEGLQRRERLRRFVSDQVFQETRKSDEQSLSLGGTRREAAILFSHIHGFETLSAKISPEELLGLLNAYFTRMDDAIRTQGGSIDKLIGDAVMAVFFPTPDLPHPAVRAVLAAELMLRETAFLSAERQDEGRVGIRTDIGVHYGMVISGNIGAKTGRLDFTVIGDVVNTASRLVGIAAAQDEGCAVVSGAASAWLTTEAALTTLPKIPIRGKAESLEIFRLTPR